MTPAEFGKYIGSKGRKSTSYSKTVPTSQLRTGEAFRAFDQASTARQTPWRFGRRRSATPNQEGK